MNSTTFTGNQVIDALPAPLRRSLLDRGRRVHMSPSEVIFDHVLGLTTVHFPVTAVLSILTLLRDGSSIEVATVGNEGTTGFPLVLCASFTPTWQCICHIPGEAFAVPAWAVEELLARSPELRTVELRYVSLLLAQMSQSVACSRLHNTVSRCARWLLSTHDRVGKDAIRLTHEFLSSLLGTRRASVTEALAALTREGMIRNRHGTIEIVDRVALEGVACECYEAVRHALTAISTAGRPIPDRCAGS